MPLVMRLLRVGATPDTLTPSASAMSPERCGPGPNAAIARRYRFSAGVNRSKRTRKNLASRSARAVTVAAERGTALRLPYAKRDGSYATYTCSRRVLRRFTCHPICADLRRVANRLDYHREPSIEQHGGAGGLLLREQGCLESRRFRCSARFTFDALVGYLVPKTEQIQNILDFYRSVSIGDLSDYSFNNLINNHFSPYHLPENIAEKFLLDRHTLRGKSASLRKIAR